ncbi:MAG: D-glycero-beta-D-manno-heptose-7-phosphate kinase [Gallionellaceae bacterium]|nr:D-glycero-beta-D-manno-heptose-7-phosphate kinase [Gallionellaceae bacterium]
MKQKNEQSTKSFSLPSFERAHVLVVGDVMLDRYWFGEVTRISPEAPVPVLKVGRVEERPGGAANVARNVAALGAHCTLLSVVGTDEAGACLEKLLEGQRQITALLHRDPTISTTIKLRAIARHQQLLRIDFETSPSHEVLHAKLADFRAQLPQADVVVLSDYGKGGLAHIAEMIQLARAAGKIVLVDPKGEDYTRYCGATILTPNRSEFRQVAGGWKDEAELTTKAERMRRDLQLDALLITRSEEGMSLYRAQEVLHEPTHTLEVFDVSGAGDTVIATLATMLASGTALPQSMHVANCAAGIVVGKLGTAVVSREELVRDMGKSED